MERTDGRCRTAGSDGLPTVKGRTDVEGVATGC